MEQACDCLKKTREKTKKARPVKPLEQEIIVLYDMKNKLKKVASILVAISFVGLIGWNATQGTTNATVSDVNLDNIEALGQEANVVSIPCCAMPNSSCFFLTIDGNGVPGYITIYGQYRCRW